MVDYHLKLALSTFVPLKMLELRQQYDDDKIQLMFDTHCNKWLHDIASKGDLIQFRGGKPGETTEAFASLVTAIACMCVLKGKIEIFDMIFYPPQISKKMNNIGT